MGIDNPKARGELRKHDQQTGVSDIIRAFVWLLLTQVLQLGRVPEGAFRQLREPARALVRKLFDEVPAADSKVAQSAEPTDNVIAPAEKKKKTDDAPAPRAESKRVVNQLEPKGYLVWNAEMVRVVLKHVYDCLLKEDANLGPFEQWKPPASTRGLPDAFRKASAALTTTFLTVQSFYTTHIIPAQKQQACTAEKILQKWEEKGKKRNVGALKEKSEHNINNNNNNNNNNNADFGRGKRERVEVQREGFVTGTAVELVGETPEVKERVKWYSSVMGPLSVKLKPLDCAFLAQISSTLRQQILDCFDGSVSVEPVRFYEDVASTCFAVNGRIFVDNLCGTKVNGSHYKKPHESVFVIYKALAGNFQSVGPLVKQAETPALGESRKKYRKAEDKANIDVFRNHFDLKDGKLEAKANAADKWNAARGACAGTDYQVLAHVAKVGGSVALADFVETLNPAKVQVQWVANADDHWFAHDLDSNLPTEDRECLLRGVTYFVSSVDSDTAVAMLWVAPKDAVFVLPDTPGSALFRLRNARVAKADLFEKYFPSVLSFPPFVPIIGSLRSALSVRYCYLERDDLNQQLVWCLSVLMSSFFWDGFERDKDHSNLLLSVFDWMDHQFALAASFDEPGRTKFLTEFSLASVFASKAEQYTASMKSTRGKAVLQMGKLNARIQNCADRESFLIWIARMGLQLIVETEQNAGAELFCKFVGVELDKRWVQSAKAALPVVLAKEKAEAELQEMLPKAQALVIGGVVVDEPKESKLEEKPEHLDELSDLKGVLGVRHNGANFIDLSDQQSLVKKSVKELAKDNDDDDADEEEELHVKRAREEVEAQDQRPTTRAKEKEEEEQEEKEEEKKEKKKDKGNGKGKKKEKKPSTAKSKGDSMSKGANRQVKKNDARKESAARWDGGGDDDKKRKEPPKTGADREAGAGRPKVNAGVPIPVSILKDEAKADTRKLVRLTSHASFFLSQVHSRFGLESPLYNSKVVEVMLRCLHGLIYTDDANPFGVHVSFVAGGVTFDAAFITLGSKQFARLLEVCRALGRRSKSFVSEEDAKSRPFISEEDAKFWSSSSRIIEGVTIPVSQELASKVADPRNKLILQNATSFVWAVLRDWYAERRNNEITEKGNTTLPKKFPFVGEFLDQVIQSVTGISAAATWYVTDKVVVDSKKLKDARERLEENLGLGVWDVFLSACARVRACFSEGPLLSASKVNEIYRSNCLPLLALVRLQQLYHTVRPLAKFHLTFGSIRREQWFVCSNSVWAEILASKARLPASGSSPPSEPAVASSSSSVAAPADSSAPFVSDSPDVAAEERESARGTILRWLEANLLEGKTLPNGVKRMQLERAMCVSFSFSSSEMFLGFERAHGKRFANGSDAIKGVVGAVHDAKDEAEKNEALRKLKTQLFETTAVPDSIAPLAPAQLACRTCRSSCDTCKLNPNARRACDACVKKCTHIVGHAASLHDPKAVRACGSGCGHEHHSREAGIGCNRHEHDLRELVREINKLDVPDATKKALLEDLVDSGKRVVGAADCGVKYVFAMQIIVQNKVVRSFRISSRDISRLVRHFRGEKTTPTATEQARWDAKQRSGTVDAMEEDMSDAVFEEFVGREDVRIQQSENARSFRAIMSRICAVVVRNLAAVFEHYKAEFNLQFAPVIFLGEDGRNAQNVRGYMRMSDRILASVQQAFVTFSVPEHCTSKNCPHCHEPSVYVNSWERRSKMCLKCRSSDGQRPLCWDRDLGAALNIYFIAVVLVRSGGKVPRKFRAPAWKDQVAKTASK